MRSNGTLLVETPMLLSIEDVFFVDKGGRRILKKERLYDPKVKVTDIGFRGYTLGADFIVGIWWYITKGQPPNTPADIQVGSVGPIRAKNLRPISTPNGNIYVYGRPESGRGRWNAASWVDQSVLDRCYSRISLSV